MIRQTNILTPFITFISVFILIIITYSVFNIPNLMWSMPWLSTIPVFFWAIFARRQFSFTQVFILGLIEDIIVGTLLGFHAFALILMYRLALQQQKYLVGKPFKVIWFGYSLSLIILFIVVFVITTILKSGISPISPFNWLITCLCFPFVYLLLLNIRNKWVK
jgi:rod shape-determining protein MreD